ncbi:hypothetical protein [Synoicihabitans lomoniglobus]|uniref:Uncharacterized protein n=1 Tax=Synoicihabitans lomoniglobus TaxID=2909285 RepID=A0AAE9ZW50_9BACT|nr:hypothetical protein [Opitutaceae bacterium LMO-M01]WED63593.1 hypothetical protein PXH66_14750 [Opitutaceae bacterium LMO-M01]
MNRTLLLILCDFLLLTLLALTRWETAEPERPNEATAAPSETDESATTAADDIVELMKLSFEDQQAEQAALAAELEAKAAALAERESSIDQLQTSVAQLDAEKRNLSSTLVQTQQAASQLRDQVTSASNDAAASRARVEQLQRDLEAREAAAAKQAEEVARLAAEKATAQAEIQNLNVAVRVAEQEKTLLRETAATYRAQAEVEREERIKVQETTVQLAEGVGQLAEKSAEITAEIRENRPINANTLFSEFLINRVPASFTAIKAGLFGADLTRQAEARTILVTDGQQTYAVMHIEDTVFKLAEPSSEWRELRAMLRKDSVRAAATKLIFLGRDPRVVAIPIEASQAKALGVKVYKLASDPFRFPEAVLINHGGEGYGEVPFKLAADLPGYVSMDSRLVRRLVGDFTASRGDLVLSKTGELLGIMVNSELCVMIDTFTPSATIQTGNVTGQNVEGMLNAVRERAANPRQGMRGPR